MPTRRTQAGLIGGQSGQAVGSLLFHNEADDLDDGLVTRLSEPIGGPLTSKGAIGDKY